MSEKLTFDPYVIKENLIKLFNEFYSIEKPDSYESGFLGYIISALTYLTSDTLFMNMMSYNEAFTHRAILPSSLLNLAQMFGYDLKRPVPASGHLTLKIPLQEIGFSFTIPRYTKVGPVPYKVINQYDVSVNDVNNIVIIEKDFTTGAIRKLPYNIETLNGIDTIVFDVAIKQIEVFTAEIPIEDPKLYIFYEQSILGIEDQVTDVILYIDDELWQPTNNIFLANMEDKVFEFIPEGETLIIRFGNGIFGKQPLPGSTAKVIIITSKGSKGNVIAGKLKLQDRIVADNGKVVTIYSTNQYPITNGADSDLEDMEVLRRKIIAHVNSLNRTVTEFDYKNIMAVIDELKNIPCKAVITRRDLRVNEISLFPMFTDNDGKPIPASSETIRTTNTIIPKRTIVNINGRDFVVPFELRLDSSFHSVNFRYIFDYMKIKPTQLINSQINPYINCTGIELIYTDDNHFRVVTHLATEQFTDQSLIEVILDIDGFVFPLQKVNSDYKDLKFETQTEIDLSPLNNIVDIKAVVNYNSNLHSTYLSSKVKLKVDISNICWCNYDVDTNTGEYIIYRVPVIDKEFYENNIQYIDENILSRFRDVSYNIHRYIMMTDAINMKFPRTVSYINNLQLNSYNENAVKTYASDYKPDLPLKFHAKVIVKPNITKSIDDLRKDIIDTIFYFVNLNADFETHVTRADITRYVMDCHPEVLACEFILPDDDIIYDYKLDMVPITEKEIILSYVPDYIYTTKDNIRVDIEVKQVI